MRSLTDCPPEMGFGYPANAGWRLWALGKAGRGDVVVKELRDRWAKMPSVILNNTLAEDWECHPDSGSQWSHCPVAPVYALYMSVAGIRPLAPGFTRCEIRPQLSDLSGVNLTAHTVLGPIRFESRGSGENRELTVALPAGCTGELVLPRNERITLARVAESELSPDRSAGFALAGYERYVVAAGTTVSLRV